MNKSQWSQKLKEEIVELQRLQKALLIKNPTYPFLYPTIENAIYAMTNLLAFIEEKNPYFTAFREEYFYNRNIAMHKSFIADLHIGTETGLIEMNKKHEFPILNSSRNRVNSIVERLKKRIKDTSVIKRELEDILNLAGKYPIFNDQLDAVLVNIKSLKVEYVQVARLYFHGINILRNNISHPPRIFTKSEIERLNKARFGNALDKKGNLRMTFEGYKLLIKDIINFFDTLHANL